MRALVLLFALFLSGIASAATTTVTVPITITHPGTGGVITTATWTNDSGSTMPAGTPVHFGQGWRYGDVPQGTFPAVQDASTHAPLAYQWDEIDRFTENGGNGSWRHSVGIVRLAAPLPAGSSVTFEFILTTGTYSQPQAVALSTLCSGPAAHDLKIHLTDIRNQDDSVRATGDATYRLCDNISTAGRDAPRILGVGSVRTEAQIVGQFVYTNATKDPLLYAVCDVGLYITQEVEWVCHVMSPWMEVAAGSAGNPGSPGPVGLANDPQIISYRPTILDGSTNVLDWSNFDATLQSPNSPGVACPESYGGPNCLNVPSSTGVSSWYWPMTVRVTSCTGVCVGGLTQGQLAWVYPSGIAAARTWPTPQSTMINLLATPQLSGASQGTSVLTNSQGTGSTTLQFRLWHAKWATWQTLDTTADENWAVAGSTARTTRRFYPSFTNAQQTYWEETGLVPPLDLTQHPNAPVVFATTASPNIYDPLGRMNVIGGTGTSHRADIGIISDYAGQAFTTQAQGDWFNARLFSYGAQAHGWMAWLNEATGRIPPLNNGPPQSQGQGTGVAYSQLGAPFPQLGFNGNGLKLPLQGVPNNTYDWAGGMWGNTGTFISHTPAFGSLTYILWGAQHFLDLMRWNGNHDLIQTNTYATEPQNLYYAVRDVQLPLGPVTPERAYYCSVLLQAQNRGSAWALRDLLLPATFGGDGEQERVYYNDCITEMANSYPAILTFMDGPDTGAVEHAALPANLGGSGGTPTGIDVFIGDYMFMATYQLQTFLHSPLATEWLPTHARWYQVLLGGGTVPNSLDPYYGIDYTSSPAVHDGDGIFAGAVTGGNIGQFLNSTDAADMGGFAIYTTITAGSGQLHQNGQPPYTLTVGDTVKWVSPAFYAQPGEAVDQLPGTQWFKVIGPIDNPNGFYFIENPATPGVAFPQFTRNGVTFSESLGGMIYRPSFVPPPSVQSFQNFNYCFYARQELAGLKILGLDVTVPQANFVARLGGNIQNCTADQPIIWDSSIVVPGSSPGAINATDFCTANGGGDGSSGNPWKPACIQAAINAAPANATVFLAAGNWALSTDTDPPVTVNKAISLVGAGSGNTVDAYGHINNGKGTPDCPTAGRSITCVYPVGTSFVYGNNTANRGTIKFGLNAGGATACANDTVAHIQFDASRVSPGGDDEGLLNFEYCAGPITFDDIRFFTYGNSVFNGETELFIQGTSDILVRDSFFGIPLFNGAYGTGQAFETVLNNRITLTNNLFWQGFYNPTDDESILYTGNTTISDQNNYGGPGFGPTGCHPDPGNVPGLECPTTGSLTGTHHATFANNYVNGGPPGVSMGGGVNDPTTNGVISDLHYTGNWLTGSDLSIDACYWRIFAGEGNCATDGQAINVSYAASNCAQSASGSPFAISNNSIVGTASARLNAQGTGTTGCWAIGDTSTSFHTTNISVFGFNAQKNYLQSPSNQYNFNGQTFSPTVVGNFCDNAAHSGATTFTQTDATQCATSGFTTPPTVTFTLGVLASGAVPITSPAFTAQYGAVMWLASTSSTTPTPSDTRWSFTPPASLSPVSHGNTVFMWVKDSVNHISAPASSVVP